MVIPGVSAPERSCVDPLCPWHGGLPVRGAVLEGTVEKTRMKRTAVIVHDYSYYLPKYKRYEKRRKKIHAHLPPCIEVQLGQRVFIGETRPLSKSVSFTVLGPSEKS